MSAYRDEMHPIAWEYICGHTEQRMVPVNTVRVQDCDACPRGGCQEWIAVCVMLLGAGEVDAMKH